jgi:hypothetical protein
VTGLSDRTAPKTAALASAPISIDFVCDVRREPVDTLS